MNGNELLQLIAIGAIAGAFGQGLRAIVGIKKASDEAAARGKSLSAGGFDVGRLIFSLFVGAIAGGIGIFTITGFKPGATEAITAEIFFGVVGIGYAGTDFIEGFIRTKLPQRTSDVVTTPANDDVKSGAGQRASAAISVAGTSEGNVPTSSLEHDDESRRQSLQPAQAGQHSTLIPYS